MPLFETDNHEFEKFSAEVGTIITDLTGHAKEDELQTLRKFQDNFKLKTEDFFRENRKLNIGVVGQVKAGKSSFLNTLLFEGKEILPKASTPKTATLTKMEYSESNIIQIEYYSRDEWEVLADNAMVDLDDEIYTSAREIVQMVQRNGLDPYPYLDKGLDRVEFDTYEDLISHLNDYVGEDGKFTPIVKAVTLYLNKEEFKGLSIVDTPGLNDPIASRTIRTKEFMEVCDVVFFLSQSGSFLDKSDWILLSSQLPQKGVKRLVLIASKYDSGIRDILRKPNEDDIFGEDENTADNVPRACKIIRRKLKRRAKDKVEEFVRDLQARGSSSELIEVIKQCADPLMVSALSYNMTTKDETEYTSEERNLASAIRQFSQDLKSDLRLLGNFDEVRKLFDEVAAEKEQIFEQKAQSFIPTAKEELKGFLRSYKEKSEKLIQVLETNDREQLMRQKDEIGKQMSKIKADIAVVFGDLNAKLETEKADAIRDMRECGKDYLSIRERTGTRTVETSHRVSDSKWYNPFSWGKSHVEYSSYEEHYSYCIASDAVENVNKFVLEASNHVEEVFTEAVQLRDLKRNLLNVVVNNFDLSSENYDASLFRIMMEQAMGMVEFPIFRLDVSDTVRSITSRFSGELTSSHEKMELSSALANTIVLVYDKICDRMGDAVRDFKSKMETISKDLQNNLLTNISDEFDSLLAQCENKEKEIEGYKEYVRILDAKLKTI